MGTVNVNSYRGNYKSNLVTSHGETASAIVDVGLNTSRGSGRGGNEAGEGHNSLKKKMENLKDKTYVNN